MKPDTVRLSDGLGLEWCNAPTTIDRMCRATSSILELLAEAHVVVVRDIGDLDAIGLSRLAASLGQTYRPDLLSEVENAPGVSLVTRRPSEAGLPFYAGGWHSDWSFLTTPPHISLLGCLEAPDVGGDTVFSSQVMALDWLSTGFRSAVDHIAAVHDGALSYGSSGVYATDLARRSMDVRLLAVDEQRQAHHPLVMRDPLSGSEHLYVNTAYCRQFVGWTVDESQPLLSYLHRWSTYEEFSTRVRWRPGSIALWNNRTTLHRVLNDHDAGTRTMLRANVHIGAGNGDETSRG